MSFLDEMQRRKALGARGKSVETLVQGVLEGIANNYADFDYSRIYDARSAGGRFPARPGDFEFFYPCVHGLIEVKEVKHDYRLPVKNMTQLPKLRRRDRAGGTILVLVFHSTTGLWRRVALDWLWEHKDAASWDLSSWKTHATPLAAMAYGNPFGARLVAPL